MYDLSSVEYDFSWQWRDLKVYTEFLGLYWEQNIPTKGVQSHSTWQLCTVNTFQAFHYCRVWELQCWGNAFPLEHGTTCWTFHALLQMLAFTPCWNLAYPLQELVTVIILHLTNACSGLEIVIGLGYSLAKATGWYWDKIHVGQII